jgi:hypothetical protein
MRRVLSGLLPPRILTRKSKGAINEAFSRALQKDWELIGDTRQWHLCRRGFADPRILQDHLTKLMLGIDPPGSYVVRILSAEQWLRSLENVCQEQPEYSQLRIMSLPCRQTVERTFFENWRRKAQP